MRILSTVTLNCQVTKIFRNSGSQLTELLWVSQMPQVSKIVFVIVFVAVIVWKVKSLLDHSLNAFFSICQFTIQAMYTLSKSFPDGISQKEKILYEMKHSYNLLHIYSVIHTIQLYTLFLKKWMKPKALLNNDIDLENILFHPWLLLRCYLPRLDHNKIISNHHAATCELSTRSIGKFTEKLISCQGHFHYTGWLSFNHSKRTFSSYIPLRLNALVSTTSTITGSWSEKLHVPTWAHIRWPLFSTCLR